jgi:hypothetical protein
MNWLGDLLFNPAPNSARSERARRNDNNVATLTNTSGDEEEEVSERIYRMVHNGQERKGSGDYEEEEEEESGLDDENTGLPLGDNGHSDEYDDDDDVDEGQHMSDDDNDDTYQPHAEADEEEGDDSEEDDQEEEDVDHKTPVGKSRYPLRSPASTSTQSGTSKKQSGQKASSSVGKRGRKKSNAGKGKASTPAPSRSTSSSSSISTTSTSAKGRKGRGGGGGGRNSKKRSAEESESEQETQSVTKTTRTSARKTTTSSSSSPSSSSSSSSSLSARKVPLTPKDYDDEDDEDNDQEDETIEQSLAVTQYDAHQLRSQDHRTGKSALEQDDEDEDDDDEEEDDDIDETNPEQSLERLTVSELKELLHAKALSTSGSKSDLIKRLLAEGGFSKGGSYDRALARAIMASKEASDLFTLNERLHDILENEAHKDKAYSQLKREVMAMRNIHAEDLADLSLENEIEGVRRTASVGADKMRNANHDNEKALKSMEAKLKKALEEENVVNAENERHRVALQASMVAGDSLRSQVVKLGAEAGAVSSRIQKYKSDASLASAWMSLYETALEGISSEHNQHDHQRDHMMAKLRNIIGDVENENSDQIAMMNRHSKEVIEEAKLHIKHTHDAREEMLVAKYAKLRKILETSHDNGDEHLTQHAAYMEEQYRNNYEDKLNVLEEQASELENEVSEFEEEEGALSAQVKELSELTSIKKTEVNEKDNENKELQKNISLTHAAINTLRDDIFEAKAEMEESQRKESKILVDYEILMTENSHLSEEIDKFGNLIKRAEKGLSAAPRLNSLEAVPEDSSSSSSSSASRSSKKRSKK